MMKKSLGVLLGSALAVTMLSTGAFAKSSENFSDLGGLDASTKMKFDAMISSGAFDGVSANWFGVNDSMNRAQFAKAAAAVMGLPVNTELRLSSFTDVMYTDTANGYALPYIEALKEAGVADGTVNGKYDPTAKVTKEQLAAFLVRMLGKDSEAAAAGGSDPTVSDWAQGYVTIAKKWNLLDNEGAANFNGTWPASRKQLVTSAYDAEQLYIQMSKTSIVSAKVTGAREVTVNFNKAVDGKQLQVTLWKSNMNISAKAMWAMDGKSVTLTTDNALDAGQYAVNVAGLDAATAGRTQQTLLADDERVVSLSFENTNGMIANSVSTALRVKAVNQYGEMTNLPANRFNAFVAGKAALDLSKDDEGFLVIRTDVANNAAVQASGMLTVNVNTTDNSMTLTQSFKVGDAPKLAAVRAHKISYSSDSWTLEKEGDTATITMLLFDQYGNPIDRAQFDRSELMPSSINPMLVLNGQYVEIVKTGSAYGVDDFFETDGGPRFRVKLVNSPVENVESSIDIYGGSSSPSRATVSVDASELAAK
ncbi:S-layer homology domain-containing protein [Paenibacillus athensensis]|nr:S-layer homology domain-containing protein [Paenibacillus athensensis]MCD1261012.1 S-layer homology domain-containing protein [Paenibacillus athensensis]